MLAVTNGNENGKCHQLVSDNHALNADNLRVDEVGRDIKQVRSPFDSQMNRQIEVKFLKFTREYEEKLVKFDRVLDFFFCFSISALLSHFMAT